MLSNTRTGFLQDVRGLYDYLNKITTEMKLAFTGFFIRVKDSFFLPFFLLFQVVSRIVAIVVTMYFLALSMLTFEWVWPRVTEVNLKDVKKTCKDAIESRVTFAISVFHSTSSKIIDGFLFVGYSIFPPTIVLLQVILRQLEAILTVALFVISLCTMSIRRLYDAVSIFSNIYNYVFFSCSSVFTFVWTICQNISDYFCLIFGRVRHSADVFVAYERACMSDSYEKLSAVEISLESAGKKIADSVETSMITAKHRVESVIEYEKNVLKSSYDKISTLEMTLEKEVKKDVSWLAVSLDRLMENLRPYCRLVTDPIASFFQLFFSFDLILIPVYAPLALTSRYAYVCSCCTIENLYILPVSSLRRKIMSLWLSENEQILALETEVPIRYIYGVLFRNPSPTDSLPEG